MVSQIMWIGLLAGIVIFPALILWWMLRQPNWQEKYYTDMDHKCANCPTIIMTPPGSTRRALCTRCWMAQMEQARLRQAYHESEGG